MAEKYVIFKIEDWEKAVNETNERFGHGLAPLATPFTNLIGKNLDDGVVIRCQDVFAGPALAMYANGIQLAIKVAALHETDELNETGQRLSAIADYFHEMSEKAYDESYKIPD